jgi:hypothetical protein
MGLTLLRGIRFARIELQKGRAAIRTPGRLPRLPALRDYSRASGADVDDAEAAAGAEVIGGPGFQR